jgi:hypothetical protein
VVAEEAAFTDLPNNINNNGRARHASTTTPRLGESDVDVYYDAT